MKCHHCAGPLIRMDGKDVENGMPGISYWFCRACGWARAITRRLSKAEMLKNLKQK